MSIKSIERLAYGYELMHRAICVLAGTSGAGSSWYYNRANDVLKRVSPVFSVDAQSNPSKPGDCLNGYRTFLKSTEETSLEQCLRDILRNHNLRAIELVVNERHDQPEVKVFWNDDRAEHGCRLVHASAETYADAISDGIRQANAVRFPAIKLPSAALAIDGEG